MTDIVTPGSTVTVTLLTGFTITSDSTVDAGGVLDGAGTIVGNFSLLNLGTITGDELGSVLTINTGTLDNQGLIFANTGSVIIQPGVAVANLASGTLTGGVWEAAGAGTLQLAGAPIITDDATITLNGSVAAFKSGSTPTTIDNSLTTVGTAGVLNLLGGRNFQTTNSLVVDGTITLGGGTLSTATNGVTIDATGLLIGFGAMDPGTPVIDGGQIEASGGTLTIPGPNGVSGGGTLQSDAGASLALQAFGGAYSETVVNNGTIDAAFTGITGTLAMTGPYSGTGGFLIEGGSFGGRTILELPAGLSAPVAFDANAGELLLDFASSYNGTISGFNNNDTIILNDIGSVSTASLKGDVLSLNGGGGVVQTLTLSVDSNLNYTGAFFQVSENVSNTITTLKVSGVQAAACYAAGTRIKTETGEIAVEHLAAGDIVQAHFAGRTPIVWIGHRHVDCKHHPEPAKVWPVMISAHAFGPRMPHTDVVLSPDHAVFIDDVLIPIKCLINGETVRQLKVDTVTYYHLELPEHDVLLAEGMPAESYLENGDRAVFDNAGGLVALHPDFGTRRWEALGCAPLVVTGAKLAAAVASLRARSPKNQRARRAQRRAA